MDNTIANPDPATTSAVLEADANTDELREAMLEEELLVEEISIDGMCGVY
jgi:mycofactocin precursor